MPLKVKVKSAQDGNIFRMWLEEVETGRFIDSAETQVLFESLAIIGVWVKARSTLPQKFPCCGVITGITDKAVILDRACAVLKEKFLEWYKLD